MIIAVPSRGRPTRVLTQKILPECLVYVPANEAKDYERAKVRNIVAVPDKIKGITRTRNWILDHERDPWVVMVDDDVKAQGWVRLLDATTEQLTMSAQEWNAEMIRLFDLTEQLKFRIFGVATMNAPRAVYPWKPLLFRSYVTASFMGILNDGRTRFDESFPVKEDYELGLRCIQEDGGVLAARYLHWTNSHWTDQGGCASYRTQEMELRAISRLRKMYPGMIRRVVRGGSHYSIDLDF